MRYLSMIVLPILLFITIFISSLRLRAALLLDLVLPLNFLRSLYCP